MCDFYLQVLPLCISGVACYIAYCQGTVHKANTQVTQNTNAVLGLLQYGSGLEQHFSTTCNCALSTGNQWYLGFDEALLLHQCGALSLLPLPLANIAAQHLNLLHHPCSMPHVACPEGQLFQEDSSREACAGLKPSPKVEVEPDVSMVAILIVGGVLDGQNVEGNHDTINRHQDSLLLLIHLKVQASLAHASSMSAELPFSHSPQDR